jgi:septal ring factor EnvC (AmiA/AmiB activator)
MLSTAISEPIVVPIADSEYMSDLEQRPTDAGPLVGELGLPEERHRGSPTLRRYLVGGLIALLFLLVVASGIVGYLAWTNKTRADDWQARAAELQADVDQLETTLDERTAILNERTDDVNNLASKVADAERAIERSEDDVKRLERRQRQLAAEKARVEDARAALALQTAAIEDVASAYIDCKSGLTEAIGYIAAQNYYALNAIASRVDADCAAADSALQNYVANYG